MKKRHKKASLYQTDLFGRPMGHVPPGEVIRSALIKKFKAVPFSFLDARSDWWWRRKRQWLRLIGLKGDAGRFNAMGHSDTSGNILFYQEKRALEKELGRKLSRVSARKKLLKLGRIVDIPPAKKKKAAFAIGDKETWQNSKKNGHNTTEYLEGPNQAGTSTFDPILCEVMATWYCIPDGRVLDPFCGGCINGIVTSVLGYKFTGIDTRKEQIEANEAQLERFLKLEDTRGHTTVCTPNWICGDSERLPELIPTHRMYDFIWTDPPYYDLEIYGSSRNDGSMKQTFAEFMAWYRRIFEVCVSRLKEDRFLAVKIGEIRSKAGPYHNFVGQTVQMFMDMGLHYYQQFVLVTAIGSLPIRTSKQFQSSRKAGNTHQTVLVFFKGNPKRIKEIFSEIKVV